MPELPKRKRNRLKKFDYSTKGAYFLTVCTQNKNKILSKIECDTQSKSSAKTVLTKYGAIVENTIKQLDDHYENITVDEYVIMPNHIHFLIIINNSDTCSETRENQSENTEKINKANSRIASFMSTFKRFSNKEAEMNMWQRSFHDHVIRDKSDYEKIRKYIRDNPVVWEYDCFYSK